MNSWRNYIFSLQLRSYCSNRTKPETVTKQKFRLLDRVFSPWEPQSTGALAGHLAKEVLYYSPGDVVVVNKPYGISCLGYKQTTGGAFKTSRYDRRPKYMAALAGIEDVDAVRLFESEQESAPDDAITLERALPQLAKKLEEPNLHFCIGLKRYVSGPVVLPCNINAYDKIKKSFFYANSRRYTGNFMYRALAICIEQPPEKEGHVFGVATFQAVRNTKEYVFIPDAKASKREVSGKYAVEGELKYHVLTSGHGCSLIELQFTKFSRHLPRLILSHLGCPILGDTIYDQRLIDVSGRPVTVEPKDRWRGSNHQYEPKQLLEQLQVKKYSDVRNDLPIFLTVYQTSYPMFGESRENVELTVRAKPPDHFHAMAKALRFDRVMHSYLQRLEDVETMENIEPEIVGKDRRF